MRSHTKGGRVKEDVYFMMRQLTSLFNQNMGKLPTRARGTRRLTSYVVNSEVVEAVPLLQQAVAAFFARVATQPKPGNTFASIFNHLSEPSTGTQAFVVRTLASMRIHRGRCMVGIEAPSVVIKIDDNTYLPACGFCTERNTQADPVTRGKWQCRERSATCDGTRSCPVVTR